MNANSLKGRSGTLDIPVDDPFKNDKLKRKDLGVAISRMLERVEAPFVACLDSPWGTGKTTFLQMCRHHMTKQGLHSVYFNAWSTDFAEDPLGAFVGELAEFLETIKPNSDQEARLKKLKKLGFYLSKRVVPVAAKLATLGILDIDAEKEGIASELAADFGKDITEAFDVQKAMVQSFRDLVKEIVDHLKDSDHVGRLIILVDEMDRCRPTYAVEVLERIKHLFDAPNVVFLLALDMQQLCSSIKGIYGSKIDAWDYLRRFIDVEYRLPEVDNKAYLSMLVNDLGIAKYIGPQKVLSFVESFATLSKMFRFSLRTQSQCAARIAIGLNLSSEFQEADAIFILSLVVLRTGAPSTYRDYVSGDEPAENVLSVFRAKPGGATFLDTNEGNALEAFLRYVQPNEQAADREKQQLHNQISQGTFPRAVHINGLISHFRGLGLRLSDVLRRIDLGFATST